MNQEIKAKWVAALRSGEYEQTRDSLRDRNGYCCLGVLCDIYSRRKAVEFEETADGDDELPGEAVVEWAGLDRNDPRVSIGGVEAPVSQHNDGNTAFRAKQRTFAEIADAIEAQL